MLPLDPEKIKTIAVGGPNANSIPALDGNYHGTSSRYVTFLEGIRAYAAEHGIRVLYSEGCHLFKEKMQNLGIVDDRKAEVELVAENADVVIACVGLDENLEGEEGDTGNSFASGDKTSLFLPSTQMRMMETLEKTGKPLVTVLAVGSSLNVPQGDAQLLTWYPGQAGGTALARILFGEVSPSGKLPLTFYHDLTELPEFTDYSMKERTYRYFTGTPLYPFGFGLSYTSFEVADCAVDAEAGWVTATVTNTGSRAGETVLQVYIKDTQSQHEVVNTHLAGFARVALQAGESKQIAVKLDKYAFTVVNDAGERIADGKTYDVYCGLSQPDARSVELLGVAPAKMTVTFE